MMTGMILGDLSRLIVNNIILSDYGQKLHLARVNKRNWSVENDGCLLVVNHRNGLIIDNHKNNQW